MEEELVRLRSRVTRLTVENLDLKASLDRGDSRSAIILMQLQTIGRSETELVQALKQLKSECLNLFEVTTMPQSPLRVNLSALNA